MYIQNATYKAVPTAGLTFPLAEGTVLTVGDVTGIVPENISLAAPTGLIYLAVGGTIDLTSEANAGVTFTDEQLNELSGDFNFIPLTEAGGSGLPAYSSSDIGKVLTVGEGSETVQTVIVPEQTVTTNAYGEVALTGSVVSGFVVGNVGVMTVNGTDYDVVASAYDDDIIFESAGSPQIGLDGGDVLFMTTTPGTYTVSLTASAPKAEPKWENAGDALTVVNITRTGVDTYEADMSYEEIDNAYSKGVVYFNYSGVNALVSRDVNKYIAEWLSPSYMNGWKLVYFIAEVGAESVIVTMNTFDLTLSEVTPQ